MDILDGLDGAAPSVIEHRAANRYLLHWRVAIVHKKAGEKDEIFHGRTYDISTSGIGIYSDHNIFVESPIVVLLAAPPLNPAQKQKIIEINSRMIYTVLASNNRGFRIGLQFLRFKGDGKRVLLHNLNQRLGALGEGA